MVPFEINIYLSIQTVVSLLLSISQRQK